VENLKGKKKKKEKAAYAEIISLGTGNLFRSKKKDKYLFKIKYDK
jgi:hypothetical protein